MIHFSTLLLAFSVAGSVTAAPTQFNKRISQTTSDATANWEAECVKAGGADKCDSIAVNASSTLLADAGPCDQQDNADTMVDLSTQLNSPNMIKFAQIFVQQPRNSPDSLSVPYCQKPPRNAELKGAFQCQFQGVNPRQFADASTLGDPGTIPFGLNAPVNPPGSCSANPSGPIPAGSQLSNITNTSGLSGGSGATQKNFGPRQTNDTTLTNGTTQTDGPALTNGTTDGPALTDPTLTNGTTDGPALTDPTLTNGTTDGPALTDPTLTNGTTDGPALTDPTLTNGTTQTDGPTTGDPTTDGPTQTNGTEPTKTNSTQPFHTINSIPVSSDPSSTPSAANTPLPSTTPDPTTNSSATGTSVAVQSGQDAQALNQKFATLTPDSPCKEGDEACVNGSYAQCVSGKFVLTPCGATLQCFALPQVNLPGTTITCDTQEDATARINAALGSTGSSK